MRTTPILAPAVAVALLLAGLLAGCASDSDGVSEEEAGALAAARLYVDALADRDLATAEAMTDPEALVLVVPPDDGVDIRAALPEVTDALSDPWVALVGPSSDSGRESVEQVVAVSYRVRDLTGGDTIVLSADGDADLDDPDAWRVTEPLVERVATYNDDGVPSGVIGPVEVGFDLSNHTDVVGYPGGYLLAAPAGRTDVDPLWIAVGAADAPPWDDALPRLQLREQD